MAGVFDRLRAVRIREAVQHAARSELLGEIRKLLGIRIVFALRLFLCIQVVEVSEELVEAVHGRQEFVPIAEVILPKLAADVALWLEEFGDGRVFCLEAELFLGKRTFVRPVRIGDWPVMEAARPAVQLCWPYQSVNSAPSLAMRSMFGVLYPMMPWCRR